MSQQLLVPASDKSIFGRIGTQVDKTASVEQWQEQAGLLWEAEKAQVGYTVNDSRYEFHKRFVLYRNDNMFPLSVVSDKYVAVQPAEIFEFFSELVEELGAAEIDTVGSLYGGRRIWALAKYTDEGKNAGGDELERHLLLTTSYEGTAATHLLQTSIRVVCQNTLQAALRDSKESGSPRIRVVHRTELDAEDLKLRVALDDEWTAFNKMVDRMRNRKMPVEDTFTLILKPLCSSERSLKNRLQQLVEIYNTAPGQQLDGAKDTAWGIMNAITFFTDHVQKSKKADITFDKIVYGEAFDLKNRAAELLLSE